MNFHSFGDFINMGGDGFYVWSSYGMGVVVFLGLWWSVRHRYSQNIKRIRQRIRRQKLADTYASAGEKQ